MTESLESFYRSYVPVVSDNHHTCVGLGFDLTKRILELEYSYPGISLALFLASCEEVFDNNPKQTIEHVITYYLLIHMISFKTKDIGNVNRYVSTPTPDTHTSEKEHVVVALNIDLGGRVGVLILDPGYHVAHPIIIMQDGLYPHTGTKICPESTQAFSALSSLCFEVPFLFYYTLFFVVKKVGSNPAVLNALNVITTTAFIPLDVMYCGMSKRPDMELNNVNPLLFTRIK